MSTQIYIEVNDTGLPAAMVVEKNVGGTRVYHRVLPVAPATDIVDQIPVEVLDAVEWGVDRFEMKVEEHRTKVLSELYGVAPEKLVEAKAALEALKEVKP